MTTLTIPQSVGRMQPDRAQKTREAVQLALEQGFGQEVFRPLTARAEEKLRILLADCGKCWN